MGAGLRLAVIAYWYPPVNESGAHRPQRFVRALRDLGATVDVIAAAEGLEAPRSLPDVHTVAVGDIGPGRRLLSRILKRILPYNDRIEWFFHATRAAEHQLQQKPVDVVISTSPPLVTHFVAAWLKWRHRVAWVADFRDPLRGNPFRTRVHGRLHDAVVDWCIFHYADAVIMNTDAACDVARSRYASQAAKIHVVWNGFEANDGLVALPVASRNTKSLVHVGTLYGAREPGLLARSLVRLRQAGRLQDEELDLRFVGPFEPGDAWLSDPAWLTLDAAGLLRYENRMVPRIEAQQAMAAANLLLLIDLNPLGTGVQVPAKLFEYVRIGRPILAITNRGSAVERILERAGVPFCCIHPGDPEASIDDKVRNFLDLSSESLAPSEWFMQTFDASRQAVQIQVIVASVCGEAGRAP